MIEHISQPRLFLQQPDHPGTGGSRSIAGNQALFEDDLALVRSSVGRNKRARRELAQRLMCIARILGAKNARAGSPLNSDELSDVAQDSVAILWSKRATFEGRASLESWMYRVGVLEWMSAIRRKRRRHQIRDVLARDLRDALDDDEQVGIESDASALVLEALQELDEPDADVIRRKYFDDASFTEIGTSLDVSPSTVKFWYYRGMDTLRGRLLPRLRTPSP